MSYELVIIIHPDSEQIAKDLLNKMSKTVSEWKGKITKVDEWGKRKLAYPIAKQEFGYYAVLTFELDPLRIKDLERELSLANDVLRFMITKVKEEAV